MVNNKVVDAIPALFGSEVDADCTLVFCQEQLFTPTAKRCSNSSCLSESAIFGDPLPAHKFVLRQASERFCVQFERWFGDGSVDGSKSLSDRAHPQTPGLDGRPTLRVLLGSEDEVPSARAVIAFAYTGHVELSSLRQALEVRQQAAYLQIEGCAAACDNYILNAFTEAAAKAEDLEFGANDRYRYDDEGNAHLRESSDDDARPIGLELCSHAALWPMPEPDSIFVCVLEAVNAQLLQYFGDAVATLNSPRLRQQLLQLPAVVLEALLASDEFGADSESSVLLLLATWMKAHYDSTDEATRKQLCQHIRLSHLSPAYLRAVLPMLALEHETQPDAPAGWFPVRVDEIAFASQYASATPSTRKYLEQVASKRCKLSRSTYGVQPRPQCLPEEGLTFAWHIQQEALMQTLREVEQQQGFDLFATFDNGISHIASLGFEWRPAVAIAKPGAASSAGLRLKWRLPEAFRVHGSNIARVPAVTSVCARLTVNRWRDGERVEGVTLSFGLQSIFVLGLLGGKDNVLPLQQQQPGEPLAAWAEYLHDGRITGTFTLEGRGSGEDGS